jgi:hypothetical protein
VLIGEVQRPGRVTAVAALVVSIASLPGVGTHYGLPAVVLGPVAMVLASRALDRIAPSLGSHRWWQVAGAASRIGLVATGLGVGVAITTVLATTPLRPLPTCSRIK